MKNAIVFHGVSSSPDDFWYPYVKKELEKIGFTVWAPQLPQANKPDLAVQLPWVLKKGKFSEETILVGHSSGASLILAILEAINIRIKQAILVSCFITSDGQRPVNIVKDEDGYNWNKIKDNVEKMIIINSTNDPWGCNDKEGIKIFDHVGGMFIINQDGHMGSNLYKQPFREFPLLIKLIGI